MIAVHMMRAAPADMDCYQRFFGCPVYFDQPMTSVVFPAETLSIAIRRPDRQLLDILQQQADQALLALPQQDEFVQQVHRHLIALCHAGEPNVQALAERMHLSVRTVQRRLSSIQLTFQQVLDEVRQQLCLQYLQQQVQLSDIAQLLGYSDQSAFTRAYKRWTGNTPHQQRMASRHRLSVGH
jgi:AraC-like DNA-binding protein